MECPSWHIESYLQECINKHFYSISTIYWVCPMQLLSANGWKLVLHRCPTLRTPTGRWEAVRSGGPVVEGCCLRWNFGYLYGYQRISMARKCMISLHKSVIKPLCKLPWDILVRLCIHWHLKKLNCWKRELQKNLIRVPFETHRTHRYANKQVSSLNRLNVLS